jgi:hypothetical protein
MKYYVLMLVIICIKIINNILFIYIYIYKSKIVQKNCSKCDVVQVEPSGQPSTSVPPRTLKIKTRSRTIKTNIMSTISRGRAEINEQFARSFKL